MIYTFYSNCYEVLQAALIENIKHEIEQSKGNTADIFKRIPIISPSSAVDDRLSHALADTFSTNPGVEFISLFEWLQPFVGTSFRPETQGSALVWQIWWALSNSEFIKRMEDDSHVGTERLLNYIKGTGDTQLDNLRRLDLCIRLSDLFTRYASYRVDWLLNWMDEKKLLSNPEKARILKQQPDYHWQKELWKFIATHDKTHDTKKLETILETIQNFKIPESMEGKTYHLFMPFSMPPLALPYLRSFSEAKSVNLWLYILNPSSKYWFDPNTLPVQLLDLKNDVDSTAQRYLITNAASTRAMIDRIYRFINADDVQPADALEDSEKLVVTKGVGIHLQKLPELQDVQLSTPTWSQFAYPVISSDNYLHKFQNSILYLDSELLPDEPSETDDSLKLFKAPTFVRELEGIVDWLHNKFREDPSLEVSDVLVVVPDIEKAAPEIEGVMGGLSEELSLPWKILDNSVIDTELSTKAIIDFGYLINSSFYKEEFLEWLELPINQERWHLSLSDISTLSNWLTAAGFRNGLSDEQLNSLGITGEDYSLDRALERLTLGYFINSSERQPCGDVLPIFGTEVEGFDKVSDNKGDLIKTLVSISEQLKCARDQLLALKDGATPQTWDEIINGWLNTFFNLPKAPQELISFRSTLMRVIEAMKAGLPDRTTVPFEVLWRLIESRLSSEKAHNRQLGAITFAPISAVRGLPFKVVVAAGLDEESGFPGRSTFDEFDLMGVDDLKRKSDRDSRDDNRAKFLDILLAARKYLVLSYSTGTDARQESNPSPVLESFKEYFLSRAKQLDNSGDLAKEIWETIEVSIPLNTFSRANFEKTIAKPWLSPRKTVLKSVIEAIDSEYSREEEVFIDTGIPDSSMEAPIINNQELPAQVLINFFNDPENFAIKKFGLPYEGNSSKGSDFDWLPDSSPLSTAIRFRSTYGDLENHFSRDDIVKRGGLDPSYGLKDIRKFAVEEELTPIITARRSCLFTLSKSTKQTETISVPLSDETRTKTGLLAVTDTSHDFYIAPDGKRMLLSIANTEAAKRRAGLKHLIWHASGMVNLVSVLLTVDEEDCSMSLENLTSDQTKELVDALVEIFSMARKYGVSLVGAGSSTLWRGIDNRELAQASKDFTDALKAFFQKKAKSRGKNQVKSYGTNFDNLMLRTKSLLDELQRTMKEVHQ